MKLTPLQLHSEQVWRDPTWSTQGENILAPPPRRIYSHESNASVGILRYVLSHFLFVYYFVVISKNLRKFYLIVYLSVCMCVLQINKRKSI